MLTKNQQLIADHKDGHAKVLAGAGSGKTTTLVARVINLVNSGIKHYDILSVMFNRDARDSYEGKLLRTYSKDKCPRVSTYHGLGSSILRRLESESKLEKFELETSEYKIIRMAMDVLDPWIRSEPGKRSIAIEFLSFVDLVKNSLATPQKVFQEYAFPTKYGYFIDGFGLFEKARIKKKIRTYGDLVYEPVKYLQEHQEELKKFSYRHVIVDEYQDISDIQMELIRMVAGQRASVMVVGDDDQCIYTWRGARPDYLITGFDRVFKNPKVFHLDETFRYGNQVAMAAHYVIKNNVNRAPKLCVSSEHTPSTEVTLDTEIVGQPSLPKQVKKWVEKGRKLSEIAVLVRSYSSGIPVEISLLQEGIPYTVDGGTPIFESRDIGALIAGLYQASGTYKTLNPADKARFARAFIQYPAMALDWELEQELIREALANPTDIASALDTFSFKVRATWQKERLLKRASAWRNLAVMRNESVRTVLDYIVEQTGVKHNIEYNAKSQEEAEDMWRRYECIYQYADHKLINLSQFSEHIDTLRKGYSPAKSEDALSITSVHRSKGLEWPFVIIPSLSQGKFPFIASNGTKVSSIEDERRLFYVAITRAQEKLVLICPRDNRLAKYLGHGADRPPEMLEPSPVTASQFIYESNLFLSQRADLLVSGAEKVPSKVVSPEAAVKYVSVAKALRGQKKAS